MNKLTEYNVKLERTIKNRIEFADEFRDIEDGYWDGYIEGLKLAETLSNFVYLNLMEKERSL